ncbi:MAG: diguanylate cyclase [Oscillospiraceae bacterium]|nr:diguanylate cyclase [Oscillospiraceae bacterium]
MKIGLKTLLSLVLIATVLIPSGLAILVGISVSSSQAVKIKAMETSALGYSQSGGLEVLIDECISLLQTTASLRDVRLTASGDFGSVRDSVPRLLESILSVNEHMRRIEIINDTGEVQLSMDGSADTFVQGAIFHASEEARELFRNEVFLSDIDAARGEFFLISRIDDDETLLGYISMTFSTGQFMRFLRDGGFLEHGLLFAIDRKGTSLGIEGQTIRVNDMTSDPLRELVSGVVGSVQDVEAMRIVDSTAYVGYYGSITSNIGSIKNGWYWFSVYPSQHIVTLPTPVLVMVIVVAVISLVCLVLSFIIIDRVTSPLYDFLKKMRKINEGDMEERLSTKGMGEYTYIAETFNEMIDEILISGEMHRAISELSDNMLFEWDCKKETLFVSNNFLNMFDVDPTRATIINGRFIDSLMQGEDIERYKVDVNKMLRSLESMNGEYQVTTKFGSVIWISIRAHCVLDRLGELQRIIGIITNINNEKLLSLQLSERASYDFLSGLYNRSTFMRELQSEITRSMSSRVGVIFIDVDDFKFVNDTYGHNTGDEIIKCVANIIKERLGSNGFAGRFGGDEFVMCVTDEGALNAIDVLATSVLSLFDKGYFAKEFDVTLKIKASLGIAIAPEHGRDNESLLAAADEAMYYVKKNGKSNFHIYNPEDSVLTELMHSI